MPSCVGFRRDGSVVLGQKARQMLATEPSCAIMSPKRLLGRQHTDPHIQSFLAGMAMETAAGPDGEVMLRCRGRQLTVTEACAHILNLLKLVAQRNLKRDVTEVVLSTPVTFAEPQFTALKQAAGLAGLKVVGFVDEPVAAALSNRYDPSFHGLVAVYDFGGGTFDFTVVEVEADGVKVIGRGGDAWLGGDDIDDVLANAAANAFWHETQIELRKQATQWQQLRIAAEVAKRELSLRANTVLRLSEAALTAHGVYDLEFPITRAQFADLCREIIDRSLQTCQQTLDRASVSISDVNAVYVSGGCSHIPAVQQALVQYFGKVPRAAVPPERAVLVGAALQRAFQIRVASGA
jgi:molecular chaperone DnaK